LNSNDRGKQWQQIKERQKEAGTLNVKLVETIARCIATTHTQVKEI
jgi:hypothetical protein